MADWHLKELRDSLEMRGWRVAAELPGDGRAISGSWHMTRAGDTGDLILDFEGLDEQGVLPMSESYACRARGTSHSLYFSRRGEGRSKARERWNSGLMGPAVLGKSTPLGSANSSAFPNGPRAGRDPHRNVQFPSHALRSCSGPAAAKPVLVKSFPANLPECAADMRPARCGADRGQLSRCCSNGSAGVLFRRQVR